MCGFIFGKVTRVCEGATHQSGEQAADFAGGFGVAHRLFRPERHFARLVTLRESHGVG